MAVIGGGCGVTLLFDDLFRSEARGVLLPCGLKNMKQYYISSSNL